MTLFAGGADGVRNKGFEPIIDKTDPDDDAKDDEQDIKDIKDDTDMNPGKKPGAA